MNARQVKAMFEAKDRARDNQLERELMNAKTAGHTPGPWIYESMTVYPGGRRGYAIWSSRSEIATLFPVPMIDNQVDMETCKADARLIAQAPKMWEALEVIGNWPLDSANFNGLPAKSAAESLANVRRYAREAIAKATGRE